jgi:hypothetical protein
VAFLTLNGMTVPVKPGTVQRDHEELGTRRRAFDGTLRSTRRALKQVWQMVTTPQSSSFAKALRGMLLGRGHNWPFDDDLYSGKGLAPNGNEVYTLRTVDSPADGSTAPLEAYAGNGSVAVDDSTSNVSVRKDTGGDPSAQYTLVDCTHAADATNYYIGSAAVSLTFSAVVNAVRGSVRRTMLNNAASSTDYSASCWLKSTAGATVRVAIWDNSDAVYGPFQVVTLPAGVWQRVEDITILTGSPGVHQLRLHIEEDTIDSGEQFTLDAIQLEAKAFTTSYVTTTRANGQLIYETDMFAGCSEGITLAAWTTGPNLLNLAAGGEVVEVYTNGGSSDVRIEQPSSATNALRLVVRDAAGAGFDLTELSAWTGAWRHVAAVIRTNPDSGDNTAELYLDGVLVQSSTSTVLPTPNLLDRVSIGSVKGTGGRLNGRIDEALVLPYPASAEAIAALAARTDAMPSLPLMEAMGDAIGCSVVSVEGEITRNTYRDRGVGGVWQNNAESVAFVLHEV